MKIPWRDDEYEPMRMNVEHPPIAADKLKQPRRGTERKNKPGQGRKPKFTDDERRRIARQTEPQAEVARQWGVSEQYVYWCARDLREGRL